MGMHPFSHFAVVSALRYFGPSSVQWQVNLPTSQLTRWSTPWQWSHFCRLLRLERNCYDRLVVLSVKGLRKLWAVTEEWSQCVWTAMVKDIFIVFILDTTYL